MSAIESPCVKDCRLAGDICTGCGRTIDQIVRWASMSAAERQDVMARLARPPR